MPPPAANDQRAGCVGSVKRCSSGCCSCSVPPISPCSGPLFTCPPLDRPDVPGVAPDVPDVPDVESEVPPAPEASGASEVPEVPDVPEVPEVPDGSAAPGVAPLVSPAPVAPDGLPSPDVAPVPEVPYGVLLVSLSPVAPVAPVDAPEVPEVSEGELPEVELPDVEPSVDDPDDFCEPDISSVPVGDAEVPDDGPVESIPPVAPLLDVPAPDCASGLPVSPKLRAFCSTCDARDGSVLSRISLPVDGCACAHPTASKDDTNKGAIGFTNFNCWITRLICTSELDLKQEARERAPTCPPHEMRQVCESDWTGGL